MKFTAQDLSTAIQFLGKEINSSDDFHKYSKSPIHQIIYKELKTLSRTEIESYPTTRFCESIKDSILDIRNPYLFSVLIDKKAFLDSFSPESKWVLKNIKNKDPFIYETIFRFEYDFRQYPKNNNLDVPFLFEAITEQLSEESKSPNQIVLLEAFCKEYLPKEKNLILNYLFRSSGLEQDDCFDFLITKLHSKKIDLSNNESFTKRFLPVSVENKKINMFISSLSIPSIKKLLDSGFSFDEKNYEYNDKNLFMAVITSERKDIIETILPTLKDITPKVGTIEEQTKFVEEFCSINPPSKVPQDLLKKIKNQYFKLLLESSLNNSNENPNKKVKI